MAKPTDKIPLIIADWRTKEFTQRELAEKYGVSNGFVAKHTKGIEQDTASLVSKGIEYRQGLAALGEHDMSSVSRAVDERTKHIDFFTSVAIKNVQEAMRGGCENQNDFRARADTILKGRETVLGKTPDTAIQINNTNAQQNNVTAMTDEELDRIIGGG